LEHVNIDEGKQYIELIKKNNINLLNNIEKYKTSDTIGSPAKYQYEIGELSPTTIRYIKVLGDLINQFDCLDNLDIVEIGCGYGGQAKIILDTFNVKSYTLIDLPPVLELTKKYLTSVGADMNKISFKTMDKLTDDKNYDLFISNYAFTECNKNVQSIYFDRVISKCKMGYITANFINSLFNLDYLTIDELRSMIPNTTLLEEEPKTHQNNVIILWK
jgi:putative sugar O-methyltransferase